MTEFAQYADTLLDRNLGQVENIQVTPRRFCGEERSRPRAIVAAVGETNESTIASQSKTVRKEDCGPTKFIETTSSGQLKHRKLCLGKDHNMKKCKFVSKELSVISKKNACSLHRNGRKSLGARDRSNT